MDLIFKPPEHLNLKVCEPRIGFKFSKNTVLLVSFLDAKGIPYDPNKLQDTPMGRGIIVDKDNGETIEQALMRVQKDEALEELTKQAQELKMGY